jgi:hypothetical protein
MANGYPGYPAGRNLAAAGDRIAQTARPKFQGIADGLLQCAPDSGCSDRSFEGNLLREHLAG